MSTSWPCVFTVLGEAKAARKSEETVDCRRGTLISCCVQMVCEGCNVSRGRRVTANVPSKRTSILCPLAMRSPQIHRRGASCSRDRFTRLTLYGNEYLRGDPIHSSFRAESMKSSWSSQRTAESVGYFILYQAPWAMCVVKTVRCVVHGVCTHVVQLGWDIHHLATNVAIGAQARW